MMSGEAVAVTEYSISQTPSVRIESRYTNKEAE